MSGLTTAAPTVREQEPVSGPAHRAPAATRRLARIAWPLAAVLCVAVYILIPLPGAHGYYFFDDTQLGAFGIWYDLGEKLHSGGISLLNPHVWNAGDYAAEGQWSLWNPVILLVGWLAYTSSNVVVFTTLLKLVFLLAASFGVYLLTRSFRAHRLAAFVAAVTVPVGGLTFYLDATSWVTGLMVWAVLPYFWWGLRRAVWQSKNPLPAFVAAYFIITVGYVHGTIALVFVFVSTLSIAALHRARRAFLVTLGLGVASGLVALTVYLPGVLTAPVTLRSATGVANNGFLGTNLTALAGGLIPTSLPAIQGYWDTFAPAPLMYVSWIFVLAPFIHWRWAAVARRPLAELAVPGVLFLIFVLGPTQLGPLRYPIRMMPYVTLTLVVTFVVLASWCGMARLTRRRLLAAFAILAVSLFFATSQHPAGFADDLESAGVVALGTAALWVVADRRRRASKPTATVVAAVIIAVVGGVSVLLQHLVAPTAPFGQFNAPASVAAYKSALRGAVDDAVVVGDPAPYGPSFHSWDQTLVGNTWYLNDTTVQNTYSTLSFAAYARDLCVNYRGAMCSDAGATLLSTDPTTGRTVADLLGVNTIQAIKYAYPAGHQFVTPTGWHVLSDTPQTVSWVRDNPVPTAGGVVWSSPGTQVSTTSSSDTGLKFRVSGVGKQGADVVLGRLAWPGYSVDNAALAAPTRGYLLTVHVPPGAQNQVVSVQFEPPGWWLEVAAWVAALLGIAAWSLAAVAGTLRRRRSPAAVGGKRVG